MTILSPYQKEMLKSHIYKSEGCSITETLLLRHFWNWLTARFPLWLAPNTITFLGLVITLCTTLSIILQDLGCKGEVRSLFVQQLPPPPKTKTTENNNKHVVVVFGGGGSCAMWWLCI